MRETKVCIPFRTAEGATIGIVGILSQLALPPHPPEQFETPMSAQRPFDLTTSQQAAFSRQLPPSSFAGPSSQAPNSASSSATQHSPASSNGDPEAARNLRIKRKDQFYRRARYPTLPVDKSYTRGLKCAVILHGVLAHKDQIYHKQLARALPIDSFRFDFRANAETPGHWSMSNLEDDLEDLSTVIDFLRNQLEYTVEVVIGHSRGGLDGFAWFTKYCTDLLPPQLRVPYFIGLSARFNMANIHERDPVYVPAFEKEGFFRWHVRVAGVDKEVHVYPDDVERFAKWPTKQITTQFPYKTDVLLIHGTADKTVPVSDVMSYGNILNGVHRRPGSCVIKLIDHADHNFRGFYPQVVEAIVEWLYERADLYKLGLSAGALRDQEILGFSRPLSRVNSIPKPSSTKELPGPGLSSLPPAFRSRPGLESPVSSPAVTNFAVPPPPSTEPALRPMPTSESNSLPNHDGALAGKVEETRNVAQHAKPRL